MSSTEVHTQNSHQDDALPTKQQLSAAHAAYVLDSAGERVDFTSLLDRAEASQTALLLVFTRHFHCGMCKEFVRALADSSLLTDAVRVSVVIVGPGQPAGLEHYKQQLSNPTTGTPPPFQFYADPDLRLYHALGVTRRNLDLGDPTKDKIGSHHTQGFTQTFLSSVGEIVKSGSLALKGGDFKQLGGEFVWNSQGEPVLAHRMRHTRDHSEVADLEQATQQQSTASKATTAST